MRRARAAFAGSGSVAVVFGLLAPGTGVVSGSAPTGGTAPAVPAVPAVPSFALLDARVTPQQAYVAGRPIETTFVVDALAPIALQVDVVREATREPVVSFALPVAAPRSAQRVEWDGSTAAGDTAPDGRYRMRVSAADGTARNAGRVELRSHIYPIRGRHADRGPAGAFGVGRNGGRTQRDYWYSHLLRTPRLQVGDRVTTGRRLGSIGATGNARTIGCHLHFEIRSKGRPIDPAPELHRWDGWS